MSSKLRILIADDHEECRWAMANLLSDEFDVIASVADGQKLVDAAKLLLPDVIVSDIRMPILTGVQAMQNLHQNGYEIPFVLVSTSNCGVSDYIKRGAMGFVDKMDMGHDLVIAVFSAALGRTCISRNADERRSDMLKCA